MVLPLQGLLFSKRDMQFPLVVKTTVPCWHIGNIGAIHCRHIVRAVGFSPIFHFFFRQFYIEAIIWHKILLMFVGSIDELHFFDIFGSGNFIGHSGEIGSLFRVNSSFLD